VGRRIGTDEVGQRRRNAAPLEIHPVLIGDAIRFAHLAEGAAKPAGTGPGPMMIEEGVAELVEEKARQHVPRDLVAAPLAGDIASVELDDFWRPRSDTRDARLRTTL